MDFLLFVLVNVALFIRPQDLIPGLQAFQIYNVLIVVNLIVAAPAILSHLQGGIGRSPALLCLIGMQIGLMMSLVVKSDLDGAWFYGIEFLKFVAYFVLMTSVLTSRRRFGWYLATVVICAMGVAALSIADFKGRIDLPIIEHASEGYEKDGVLTRIERMSAYGVFADPNDLAMLSATAIMILLGAIYCKSLGMIRWLSAPAIAFFGYAILLTQSRGGLLALMGGLCVALVTKYGSTKATLGMAVLVPGLIIGVGGRQADIGGAISGGTGGTRTELWHQGLNFIKWEPLFGIGHGRFVEEEGHVAHNSFIQALAEWGVPTGGLFIGLFFLVVYSLWRLRKVKHEIASPALRIYHPFILGAIAAYIVAMMSLTRTFIVPTYMIAGLGLSYERLARQGTSLRPVVVDSKFLWQVALATIGFIALIYVYIRFIYRLF